ncbi:MAG TPA: cellulase family glycosylhydrolase [Solirubrobacteraceae bacterium]|nr:cellulase family glycosylhydrolase [Solirubrobacteraceae bacterium]
MPNRARVLTHPARGGTLRRLLLGVCLAGILGAGVGTASAPPAAAAEPGVVVPGPSALHVNEVKALGTHWVRMFLTWPDLQPSRGVWAPNWVAYYEQAFSALPAGTKVILDVVNSPRWETGSTNEHTPPAKPSEYAAFIGALAQKWAGRVAAYEIWNEEDHSRWWTGAPDPAAYARLLKAAYPAVKAGDPGATVVLGGMTGNDYSFLEGVYQAGGKGSFDAVGVHTDTACNILSPYLFLRGEDGRMIPDSFLAYREVRATMLANGDDKPIWMTETSWRTTSATCSEGAWAGKKAEGVTEEQQAIFLSQAYHCLAQDPYVQVALWFPLQDEGGIVAGLVRANGSHKPSFAAMQAYASQGDQLTEPCGTVIGPKITVVSPGSQQSYTGPMPIHVFASSPAGVWRIRLVVDGKLVRNFDDLSYPSGLSGAIMWMGGKHISLGSHTLRVLAYDKEHNVSEVSVTVFHGAKGAHAKSAPGHTPSHHAKRKHRKRRTRKHHHRTKHR